MGQQFEQMSEVGMMTVTPWPGWDGVQVAISLEDARMGDGERLEGPE